MTRGTGTARLYPSLARRPGRDQRERQQVEVARGRANYPRNSTPEERQLGGIFISTTSRLSWSEKNALLCYRPPLDLDECGEYEGRVTPACSTVPVRAGADSGEVDWLRGRGGGGG